MEITNVSKDFEKAREIMNGYLNNDYENNVVLLNEMKSIALKNQNILKIYKEMLLDNYKAYLKTVTEDNLETFLKITNSIPKFLNISFNEVLSSIFNNLEDIKNKQKVYETMVENGFDKEMVILYVNPLEEVLKQKTAHESSLLDLINYDNCIKIMQEQTNIYDYTKYVFDEDLVNKKEFKGTYNTAKNMQKKVEFFQNQNKELFDEYNGFMSLFGSINDHFNILDNALANPSNIKKDLIDKKIDSGDYQYVFVNLSVKLESILKNKYHLSGKLSDMLSLARDSGAIKRNIINDLHDFRANRNAYIHPGDRNINFRVDDLRRWNNEIFSLEEDKDE